MRFVIRFVTDIHDEIRDIDQIHDQALETGWLWAWAVR